MCLGVPGEVLDTHAGAGGLRYGTVRFGGREPRRVPRVRARGRGRRLRDRARGPRADRISREDADEVFGYLEEMEALSDLSVEMGEAERAAEGGAAP